ncbi:MAG: hypothetical protein ACON35_08025 [Candidatus Marinamargulisbacteria bacterium]
MILRFIALLFGIFPLNADVNHRLTYDHDQVRAGFNIIIVIEQISNDVSVNRPILTRLRTKIENQVIESSPQSALNDLVNNGYQLITLSYLNNNELFQPGLDQTHMSIHYPIRSRYALNSERKIFTNGFMSIDQFVRSAVMYRPLCILIILPKEQQSRLSRMAINRQSFYLKRDFSLINLYHEIHKRRYLYPNKLILFSSLDAKQGIVFNNK